MRFVKLNPDSAVERQVMTAEQIFRSEDNAFMPLRRPAVFIAMHHEAKQIKPAGQAPKRTLKLNTPVSSLLKIHSPLIFQLRVAG